MTEVVRKAGRLVLIPVFSALALLPSQASAQEADDKPSPLSAETLWKLKRLGTPTLSPEGVWCALSVTRYDVEKDEGFSDIWLVPTRSGEARQLTTHISKDDDPVWSPDGRWIAFVAKRNEDEADQIYIIPTDGGEARRVTNVPTGASAPKWFPDSARLAFFTRVWTDLPSWEDMKKRLKEREESKMTAKTWDGSWVRYWNHFIDDREAHVYTISLEGGEPVLVTLGTGLQLSRPSPGGDGFDISPDGKEIAFAADIDETGVDQNYDIHLVPVEGGEAVNITTDNPADDTTPQYCPDGRFLKFSRQKIKGFYADKQRLMIYDRQSKQSANCTEKWDRSADGLVWLPDGGGLYGAIDDVGYSRVYRFDAKPSTPTPITKDETIGSLAMSRDGKTLVGLQQSFTQPPTLVRIDASSGAITKLSKFNDEVLSTVQFGTHESVTVKGANGDDVQVWINYPPDFDRTKKWPLYLLIHGGPHGAIQDSFHWRWNAQAFSAPGYVTTWHNFHGSSGFGQDYCDSINPNWADMPYEDTMKVADYLAKQPWIDENRMAAGGGSYGGYLSTIILGREHPFKTLIVHAGVYNRYTQYGADYAAGKKRFGEHWENPDMMRIISPHYHAGEFKTPTLVIHGQQDYRVPVNHAFELYNTLQTLGIKSRLIYYPNENHWVLNPQNSIHWYNAKKQWLSDMIGAGPTEE